MTIYNSQWLLLVTAQEDATIDVEDGIQFTPFNMHVEMEEGRFDADGTYIPNKTVIILLAFAFYMGAVEYCTSITLSFEFYMRTIKFL